MASILDMRVRLYDGHHERWPDAEPEWTGTLNAFWQENQDGYNWGEIRNLAEVLKFSGRMHIGGGAAAEFTLFREGWPNPVGDPAEGAAALEVVTSRMDRAGLPVSASLVRQLQAERAELLAALKRLLADVLEDEERPLRPESVLAARDAIAKAKGSHA